jgi:hypothetical protein
VLVLYDVSSPYFEGRHCPLAQYGHSRDHRGDRPQIVYGLLCTRKPTLEIGKGAERVGLAFNTLEARSSQPQAEISAMM